MNRGNKGPADRIARRRWETLRSRIGPQGRGHLAPTAIRQGIPSHHCMSIPLFLFLRMGVTNADVQGAGEFTKLASELAYGKDCKPLAEGKVCLLSSTSTTETYLRSPYPSPFPVLEDLGSLLASCRPITPVPRRFTCQTLLGETISLLLRVLEWRSLGTDTLTKRPSGSTSRV